jgi:hypothetical protein
MAVDYYVLSLPNNTNNDKESAKIVIKSLPNRNLFGKKLAGQNGAFVCI